MKPLRFLLVVAAGLLAGTVPAQTVPSTMNYQGRLSDNTPQQSPLNATVNMQFEIWGVASGGNANPDRLWVEPASGAVPVPVTGGVFSVTLGGNGVPLPAAVFSGGAQRWLQLIVNGETLAPRQALAAAGYANQAENAGTAASALDSQQLGGVAPAGWQRALGSVACPSGEFFTVILPDGTKQCAPPVVAPPVLLSYSDPGAILTVVNNGSGHAIDASASGGHALSVNQSGGGTAGYFTGSAASASVLYVLSNGSAGITVSNQSVASAQPGITAGTNGSGPGVKGSSSGGPGVEGSSSGGPGVEGASTGGNPGVRAASATAGPALKVDASGTGTGIQLAQTGGGTGLSVTQSGGGVAASFTGSGASTGTITAFSSGAGGAGSFQNQSAGNALPALSGATSGTGPGVSGSGQGGAGMSGTSISGPGVSGASTSGNAGKFQITAAANASAAVLGTTSGTGAGVSGSNTAASGVTYGVYGDVTSANGYGLYTPDKTYAGGGYKQPGVGGEVLRIVRGVVNSVGGVASGTGFIVSKLGTGRYSVTCATAFSSLPAITVTTAGVVIYYARVSNVSLSGVEIDTYDQSNVPADVAFHFIAIGVP